MTEITDFINNDIKALRITDSVSDAQDLFAEYPFSHFPVLEEGIYIGSARSEDMELMDIEKTMADLRFSFDRFYVRDSALWLDVLEVFAKNETNLLPVLDKDNKYLGYYEITDIITFFHETPFLKEAGGIIVVEKGINDYSISQAAQIVESNNGRLLGLFISESNMEKCR